MRFCIYIITGLLGAFLAQGCSTEVDINAPAKDIWVVNGVLNTQLDQQYIRITRGFLPEGNAFDFARENDLSAKGLVVELRGANQIYLAVEVDSVPKEPAAGIFYPTTTLYRFDTQGQQALKERERYDLVITKPDNNEFFLRAHTSVPTRASFPDLTIPGGGQQRCLRPALLEGEFKLEFGRGNASAFEIRAFLDYEEDGVPKMVDYGPTPAFTDDFRCNVGGSLICYKFREKEILRTLLTDMNIQPNREYTYAVNENTRCNSVVADLPQAFRVEVTSLDTFLYTYQVINNPQFTDFNTVRPEYTNITGSDELVYGIFGSVSVIHVSYQLSECSTFLLQLNDAKAPSTPCEL